MRASRVYHGLPCIDNEFLTFWIAIFVIIAGSIVRPANAAELLIAVLQDKEGKTSLHKITLIDGACTQMLTNFRGQAENDRPIWPTLPQGDRGSLRYA